MKEGTQVLVEQIRGNSGRNKRTVETLQALGLGRIGKKREHVINGSTMGMINKVDHLVKVLVMEKKGKAPAKKVKSTES